MKLRAAMATDAGLVRSSNQDRALIVADRLFAVADGMGGHRGGATAARLAVESLEQSNDMDGTDALGAAIEAANEVIFACAGLDQDLTGMGTTLTAVSPIGNGVMAIANVGDSRTYLLRNGELRQITDDHSVVAELQREGRLTAAEARDHPRRSMLTRALGVDRFVHVDLLEFATRSGDRFLLCSDGLTGEVTDDGIGAILRRLAGADDAAAELVRTAVACGGRDNVTVVVVDVLDAGDGAAPVSPTDHAPTDATNVHGGFNDASRRSVRASADARPQPGSATQPADAVPAPAAGRHSGLLTVRTAIFAVVLGAIAVAAVWAVRNDPESSAPPDSTIPAATTTTEDPFDPASTTNAGTTVAQTTIAQTTIINTTITQPITALATGGPASLIPASTAGASAGRTSVVPNTTAPGRPRSPAIVTIVTNTRTALTTTAPESDVKRPPSAPQ